MDKRLKEFGNGAWGNADTIIRDGESEVCDPVLLCRQFAITGGGKFEALLRRALIELHENRDCAVIAEFDGVRQ